MQEQEQDQRQAGTCLVFKVESLACALPVAAVVETMRPLPLQRLEKPIVPDALLRKVREVLESPAPQSRK